VVLSLLHANGVFLAIVVGLVVGALMSYITEYYTAMGKRPVLSIIEKSGTGHATNIIGGLAVGMESTVLPIITLAAGYYPFLQICGSVWRVYRSRRDDGHNGHAVGD
jgi:Na+/H+-translocating membrane pyrophosphatase